jgi:hypothetical protein
MISIGLNSRLQTIIGATTLQLSGQTEASSAEEQLARDNRMTLRRTFVVTTGRPTASRTFFFRNEYPEPRPMPPKTLGSGGKPQVLNTTKIQTGKVHFTLNQDRYRDKGHFSELEKYALRLTGNTKNRASDR